MVPKTIFQKINTKLSTRIKFQIQGAQKDINLHLFFESVKWLRLGSK